MANFLVRDTYVHHDYDGPPTGTIFILTALGFLISSVLGWIYRRVPRRQPERILVLVTAASLISAFIWAYSGNLIYSYIDPVRWDGASFGMYLVGILNAGFILLCWSAGYFSFRYYQLTHEQRLTMVELKQHAQQTQLQMLRYQLNPHFMFNTLTSISALIRDRQNEAADEMVERLGDLLRQSLRSNPIDMVSLREELATLDMYLQLEKVRFQERLKFTHEYDDESMEVLVPGFLLQPLVENSIKHAIAVNEQGGSIHLAAKVKDGRLLIRLEDSGSGDGQAIDGHNNSGVGLKNVQQRLVGIYQADYSFDVGVGEAGGYVVSINLPAYTPE